MFSQFSQGKFLLENEYSFQAQVVQIPEKSAAMLKTLHWSKLVTLTKTDNHMKNSTYIYMYKEFKKTFI